MRAPALGKGLGALISEETVATVAAEAPTKNLVTMLPLTRIKPHPNQPRKIYKPEALAELRDSISKRGVLQPILVTPTSDGEYQIIAGERRWRAAGMAQLKEIPAIIRSGSEGERFELALIENIQREDLNALEQAQGYQRLVQEFNMTQEEVARVIGKDRTVIANAIRLLALSESMQQALLDDKISPSHARALVAVEDSAARETLFQRILGEQLSVRATEQAVQQHKVAVKGHTRKAAGESKPAEVRAVEEDLQRVLTRKVELQTTSAASQKGWIKLEFYSLDDLDALIAQLKRVSTAS
jgi:ParB family transcriptional regulator, chromosome partitioning protein